VGATYSSFLLGRLEDSLRYAERNVALSEGDVGVGVEEFGFSTWGSALQCQAEYEGILGRLDTGWSLIEQALRLAREHDLRDPLIWSLHVSSRLALLRGDHAEQALRNGLEAMEVAERTGSAFQSVFAHLALANAHMQNAAWEDAAAAMESGLAVAREHRSGLERESAHMALLAWARLGADDVAGAGTLARQAITRAREQGARFFEAEAELILARVLTVSGELPDARSALARARVGVEETGGRSIMPMIEEQAARVTAEEGGDPNPELERARDLFTEIGAAGHAQRLARELEGLAS
jgi:ATP/maltotriose-dependent transcriptional regulator MalT